MNTILSNLLNEVEILKIALSTLRPLPTCAIHKIQDALAIAYIYESNRIEGNTLTLQETALIVNEGVIVSGKSMREHLEAINHAQAVYFINDMAKREIAISQTIIKKIHALILHGIDRENAGRYRNVPIMISGSTYLPPSPFLIEKLMEEFMFEFDRKEKEGEHPVIIAAYLHDELVRIHPFIDGNGRTSRLLMNLYLLQRGYTLITLKSDDDIKLHYYNALEKSHTENNTDDFYLLIAEAERDALKRYVGLMQ